MKIYLPIELDLEDIASAISEKTDDDIYDFIKRLADPLPYEWTVELFKYLAEDLKKCEFLEDEIGMTFNELMEEIKKGIV